MMHHIQRRWLVLALFMVALAVLVVASFGTYMASEAGVLPWQPDPTRIPVTPF